MKTTHDGSVALIDDGLLIFSHEMEKLDNNPRYSKIEEFGVVFSTLAEYGYAPGDVDVFALDGWHNTRKRMLFHGQETEVTLAPYRRGILSADLFHEFRSAVLDLEYSSYPHYAGHVAGAYCTSPFAVRGESAYVLSWDGLMFPYLYFVEAGSGKVHSLGSLFPLIGNTYHALSQNFAPFDKPLDYPQSLGLAGKIMAYIAKGQVREEVVAELEELTSGASKAAGNRLPGGGDLRNQLDYGWKILDHLVPRFKGGRFDDADMLASVHTFLERKLLAGLRERIAESPYRTSNLCVTGGCGLNIKWNSAIRSAGLVDEVWVPPFPNDAGNAIGVACCAMLTKTNRRHLTWDVYSGPALRPSGTRENWIRRKLDIKGLAALLHSSGEPVVFLDGRAEAGPRALGNRSILAPASAPEMKATLNRIKQRENYRPIAPVCLEHRAAEVFSPGSPDPFMVFDHQVRAEWVDRVPAIRHLDGTARLQTVNARQNAVIFELLTEYEKVSGIPLLCNTSANLNGSGFFPDVESAMTWGKTRYIWSNGMLHTRT